MPTVFLDRLPLPSLQAYTTISVLLISCSVYYAMQMTSEYEWKFTNCNDNDNTYGRNDSGLTKYSDIPEVFSKLVLMKRISEVSSFMLQEPLCIWTVVNMAYCCLILLGKFIQKVVFGDLRVSEQQHIKDKFWNFVFYKFIFIFGVMNVQYVEEVILWSSWFSFLGFLHLLSQLCKDRFEYLSFSPTTPKKTHLRLLILLCIILVFSFGLIGTCIFVYPEVGLNTFAFMTVECLLVTLRTSYVLVRYGIHLWDISHDGVWEKRASYVYYTELIFEMVALILDFIHHLHMLLWGNIFLSMASLVILMQLRYLFYEIRHRLRKYKNYLRIVRHMETTYPLADSYELENNNDDCAICWDHMDFARKLPCGHLFHNSCLRSWLEQDTSCPTCRKSLTEADSSQKLVSDDSSSFLDGNGHFQDSDVNETSDRFFPFGSHYTSWWPALSIEVSRSNLTQARDTDDSQNTRLDTMAREVQRMFPNVPLSQITDDLRVTHSIEVTVEHILDEKLVSNPSQATLNTKTVQEQDSLHEADLEDSLQLTSSPEKEIDMTAAASSQTYLEDTVLPLSESEDERGEKQPLSVPSSSGLGVRFSKSPEERQSILSHRKEEMIEDARRRYLNRLAMQNSVSEKAALTSLEERINRNRSRNMLCSLFLRIREM